MAASTVFGPVYPLPGYKVAQSHGGSSCKQTGSIELGNLNWSFGSNPSTTAPETASTCADTATPPAFDPTRNQALYWGLNLISAGGNQVSVGPTVGPNGQHLECPITTNTSSGPLVYDKTLSTPATGVLVYTGTTDSTAHLTLTFRDANGAALNGSNFVDATTLGTFKTGAVNGQALGLVLKISPSLENFNVSAAYSIQGAPLTTWNPNCGTTSDIDGGFYYVDLPPSATIKATPSPVGNHTTTTFSVDSVTDPYAADDGGPGLSYAWDKLGGTSYSDGTGSSIQSSYGPGSHTVALRVMAPDGLATREEYPFTITNSNPTGEVVSSPATPLNHQQVTFGPSNDTTDPDQGNDGTCAAPTMAYDITGGNSFSSEPGANVGTFGPGQHTVAMQITDCDGGQTVVTDVFTIPNVPPVAAFSCTPAHPIANQLVTCTSSSHDPDAAPGDALTEKWTQGTATHTGHTFAFKKTAGSYPVKLAVTDRDANTTPITHNVTFAKPAARVVLAAGQRLAGVLTHGIKASLRTNEHFTSSLTLKITKATSKTGKPITVSGIVATASPSARAAGSFPFTLTLSSAAKQKLAQAKSASFHLAGTARDSFGNSVPVALNFTLS